MVDEFLGLAYARQYEMSIVLFRLFNTVGPRQTGSYGMVMPRFVQAALAGEPLQVYGDGAQTRCFCHVADAVRAIVGARYLAHSPADWLAARAVAGPNHPRRSGISEQTLRVFLGREASANL